MREIFCFCFNHRAGEEHIRLLYDSVKNAITNDYDSVYTVELYADTKECDYVLDYAEKHAISYRLIKRMEFTKKEIRKARYFHLYMLSNVLELEGTDTKDYGTAYKGGCELCGLGSEPVADVLVDRKFMRNKKIGQVTPEYFVSGEVRKFIEESGFTGVEFRHRITDYKGRDMDKFFTLDAANVLPAVSSPTLIRRDECDVRFTRCEHKVLFLDSNLYYDKDAFKNAKDFNLTNEYFNNDRMRQLVVSAKVKKAMSKKRLNVHFSPILINGENYES